MVFFVFLMFILHSFYFKLLPHVSTNEYIRLDLSTSDLAGHQVERLLAYAGDATAALLCLLGDLQLVQGQEDGADQATGGVLVYLWSGSSSIKTKKK